MWHFYAEIAIKTQTFPLDITGMNKAILTQHSPYSSVLFIFSLYKLFILIKWSTLFKKIRIIV